MVNHHRIFHCKKNRGKSINQNPLTMRLFKKKKKSKEPIHWREIRKKEIFENCSYCFGWITHEKTTIGKFCSIADGSVIGATQHPMSFLSTHAFTYEKDCDKKNYGNISNQNNIRDISHLTPPCEIGHDVWIGSNAFIKAGVKIGIGAVVGANAMVTKDVPPYAIVGGVPAKIIRYRFNPEIIERLLQSKWWDLPKDIIVSLPFDDIVASLDAIENLNFFKN